MKTDPQPDPVAEAERALEHLLDPDEVAVALTLDGVEGLGPPIVAAARRYAAQRALATLDRGTISAHFCAVCGADIQDGPHRDGCEAQREREALEEEIANVR